MVDLKHAYVQHAKKSYVIWIILGIYIELQSQKVKYFAMCFCI